MRLFLGLALFLFCVTVLSAQENLEGISNTASVEKSLFGVQTGLLGVWGFHEARLGNKLALRSELGLGLNLFSFKSDFAIFPMVVLEPRYYYNLDKRAGKQKSISKNSGNYITLSVAYAPDLFYITNNDSRTNYLPELFIAPTWGIRRHIGNNFNYEAGIGAGYVHYHNKLPSDTNFGINVHLRIGYTF